MSKRVCLLGSTGSIGTQTLEVIRALTQKGHGFKVCALAAGENLTLLARQISEFGPRWASVGHERDLAALESRLGGLADSVELRVGEEGLRELIVQSQPDLVVNALVGAVGLTPTLAALDRGIDVALANKESLVIGGHLVKEALRQSQAKLIPVDSEHHSLFRLLEGLSPEEISGVLLTASGGALRDWPLDRLEQATPQDVLKHPTWQMGRRITVDSATLVNKAFEVIEAHQLFELPFERIDVVIHPQSVVHGLVELSDGSLIAHMSPPDMRGPIQYALTYPEAPQGRYGKLDWCSLRLEFSALDPKRYPAFGLIMEAGRLGKTYPAVANGADEVLVERFLKGEISFPQIASGIEEVLAVHAPIENPDLEDVLAADRWAREWALHWERPAF